MKKGFTLVELMIVLSIIAVLSGIGLVLFNESQKIARDGKRKQDLRSIQFALESYYRTNGRYPCSTDDFNGLDADWNTSFNNLGANWWIGDNCDGISFDGRFMDIMPRDSKDTGNYPWVSEEDYSYAYLSPEDIGEFVNCPRGKGQYYILVARLERTDGEVKKPEDVKFCDGDPIIGYHEEIVLMGQDVADPNFDKLLILTSQE